MLRYRQAQAEWPLEQGEYLRIEKLYVHAIMALVEASGSGSVLVHGVEFWESESRLLAELGLDDVFDGSPMAVEGEAVSGHRLENIVRRCLREVAWLELLDKPRILIHFGYDLRVIVASMLDLRRALEEIRSMGLFVYESNAALPTLDTWSPGG